MYRPKDDEDSLRIFLNINSYAGIVTIVYYLWLKFSNLALDSPKPFLQQDKLSVPPATGVEEISQQEQCKCNLLSKS